MPSTEQPPEQAYIDGVFADLERWEPSFNGAPSTLYFGGGTPSRLSPATIGTLIDRVNAPDVTLEANPEDLVSPWLTEVVEAGVTRISLGVQSLTPRLQRVVGRAHHDPAAALALLATATLTSWSADLMFGLPGQTLEELDADLDALLAWHPPHVSIYDLSIEPGTGFHRLHQRRRLDLPDEGTWCDLQDRIVTRLQQAGFERYEVSNFAQPGHRSAHNQLYWTQRPYLGAGPSAHGFAPDGRRWFNADWTEWRTGAPPTIERPTPFQAATDAMISGLRGIDGLPLHALHGFRLNQTTLEILVDAGMLYPDSARIRLTGRGFDVSDSVVRTLVGALVPDAG